MKKDDSYRFNLLFKADSDIAEKVGAFLEGAGNKKSKIVVSAVAEYLENHPEILNNRTEQTPRALYQAGLEKIVKSIVMSTIGELKLDSAFFTTQETTDIISDAVDDNVMTLLDNLSFFEKNGMKDEITGGF